MFRFLSPFVIRLDFPALDRLIDFWESKQQQEIDALTAKLQHTTAGLQKSQSGLDKAIKEST